jgi:hypothetical protein
LLHVKRAEVLREVGIVGSDTLQFLPGGDGIVLVPEEHVIESQHLVRKNLLRIGFDSFLQSIKG